MPYADTFAVEEDWCFVTPNPNVNACALRISMQVIFYKSTIFKSKIMGGAQKGARDVWAEWVEWVKKRNLTFKEKKGAGGGKLTHGIEKSNMLFEAGKLDGSSTGNA